MYKEKKSEYNIPLIVYILCSNYIYFHIVAYYLYVFGLIVQLFNFIIQYKW